jgi:hypothetical protein
LRAGARLGTRSRSRLGTRLDLTTGARLRADARLGAGTGPTDADPVTRTTLGTRAEMAAGRLVAGPGAGWDRCGGASLPGLGRRRDR